MEIGARRALVEAVGNDLYVMKNELAKLAMYVDGREIVVDDVSKLVAGAVKADVFAMIEGLATTSM